MTRLRFSLTGLLVVVTGVSIWMAKTSEDARQQEAAVKEVERNEGNIQFDTRSAPKWLSTAIGEEYFRDVKVVDLATNRGRRQGTNDPKATDESIVQLAVLDSVETLELGNAREVTDAGLVHLARLKNLTTLYLYQTGVRGPGLVHLERLPKLKALSLAYTDLNDSGLKHTDCRISR